MHSPKYIVVDLFCGAGGTTTGFDAARIGGHKAAYVVACVNHDAVAIESHWQNHPEVEHFNEDITELYGHVKAGILFTTDHMQRLIRLVNLYRAFYPGAKLILWASLECTNFSKAKGGQARDADSRTLAQHLDRYIAALDPDYVQVENVVEFQAWGPMTGKVVKSEDGYQCCKVDFQPKMVQYVDDEGFVTEWQDGFYSVGSMVPESSQNGKSWVKWKEHLCAFNGYRDDWRKLNSADFGAYTSRNRLFGIFAKHGEKIVWPRATHAKKPAKGGLFGSMKKWKPVKDVLDLKDEGKSILDRKKPLVDPSLERVYAGLIKFVAGGKDAFLLKYNSMTKHGVHVPPSIEDPCPVIAAQNRLGLVVTNFFVKNYSGHPSSKSKTLDQPADTITGVDHHSLVTLNPWVMNTSYNNVGTSLEDPAQTLVSSRRHPYKVTPVPFIQQRNSGDPTGRVFSVDNPARTLTATGGNQELVNPVYLIKYYSMGTNADSIESIAATLGTKDTLAKIQAEWLELTYGTSQISSTDNPAGSIMPNDKHRLIQLDPVIMNPSHGGHSTSAGEPCPVIIARQDKAPLYLIQYSMVENVAIAVYPGDSDVMVRIKLFMAMYGISDIKMRMLRVDELLLIQGFPENYKLAGNQTDQKKFIGNSVVPHVVKCWTEAMAGDGLVLMAA